MAVALAIFGVTLAAFCVWLAVRLVNRGWRPGRRFWIIVPLVLLLAYPVSFGPACWLTAKPPTTACINRALIAYWPLVVFWRTGLPGSGWLGWWMFVGVPKGHAICVPVECGDILELLDVL